MSVKTAYSSLSDTLTKEKVAAITCITTTIVACFGLRACNTNTEPPPKVLDDDELLALHLMVSPGRFPETSLLFLSLVGEVLEMHWNSMHHPYMQTIVRVIIFH